MGLGALAVLPNDVIFVARGGEVPFLLRQSGGRTLDSTNCRHSHRNAFYLVGPCYISGTIDGEVFQDEKYTAMSVHMS
jgi:hypothetical protein